MMVFKRKQVVVLSLILMIVVAGYLQYTYKNSGASNETKNTDRMGEAVYVDTEAQGTNESKETGTEKTTNASQVANDFFASAKLDRDITRSQSKDQLDQISKDKNADSETRKKAYDEMIKIITNSEKEKQIEKLVSELGYSDVVAFYGEDGSIDIVVKAPNLNTSQTAKITDVVTRQGKIDIGKIVIKNLY